MTCAIVAMSVYPGERSLAQDARRDSIDAASSQAPPPPPAPRSPRVVPPTTDKSSKLASQLKRLHGADAIARAAGAAVTAADQSALSGDLRGAVKDRMLRIDDAGRVQVYVETEGAPTAAEPALRDAGLEVERVDNAQRLIQGRIPIAALKRAASLPGVRQVRPPEYAIFNPGPNTTQGDAILQANQLRATYGVNGAGVRVGVISDGIEALWAAQWNGELGAVNSTTCDMVPAALPNRPANPTDAGAGAEGTAMLEIAHDIAPGAELWFGYFDGTSLGFPAAVDCLAANTDVVIDDIVFFNNGSYNGSGPIAQNASTELNRSSNRIRGYYNAVGNLTTTHYEETYVDGTPADTVHLHLFQPTADTTDGLGLGPQIVNPVYLLTGGFVVVFLQWNDTFGASANDYDLFLFRDSDATVVTGSDGPQTGTQNPTEAMAFENTGPAGYYDIAINRFAGVGRTFDMFLRCSGCVPLPDGIGSQPLANYNTARSSVAGNADAGGGVMSLGAINASDPGSNDVTYYSSRGPTNDGRTKPDATAIDGVAVSGAGGFPSPFYGTSAAGPHAGAIAALVLACKPSLKRGEPGDNPATDRTALRNALLNSAVDLGAGGVDNTYGAGRLDADNAATAAGCSTADTDSDGCSDFEEGLADRKKGGQRDLNSPWDFFDVPVPALLPTSTSGTRSKAVSLSDTLAILGYVGAVDNGDPLANGADYDSDLNANGKEDGSEYDRAPSAFPSQLWRSGAPNQAVTLQDALVVLAQVGDSCLAAP